MTILTSIIASVAGCAAEPIRRQLGYLFTYKQNVEDLNPKIDALKDVKQRIQHKVEKARNNARGIEADVNKWLAKAEKIITEDHENFTRDEEQANTNGICGANFLNLVLRHRLSSRAKEMAEAVDALIREGEKTLKKGVSYRPKLPSSVSNKGYEDFESRNRTLTNVMEALRDPTIGMVGVWGMGGVGKTMLAKEVARRAMDGKEKLFTKVVFTAISKEQNIINIQQDIGEKLYVKIREKSKDVRAQRLRSRLRQENNILIILDDIWGKLDLEGIGISFGKDKQGCKILLTTRSYHVLANDMDVDSDFIFKVGVLWEHEAKSLFRKIVGDQAEKQKLQGLASEIVEECAGLPIAITTVASALKNKKCAVWKSALHGLRNSKPGNIPGMEKEVYNSVQFSIDCLESVEAKHLLLLCSLFPEDAEIPIRELCGYGFGLNLFEVNTLEEARNKTDALVTKLKEHSLLLDVDSSYLGFDCVKLHDVIRDVVIYVATQIQYGSTLKQVPYRPKLPSSVGNKGYEDFESRNQTLTNVMEALRDPNVGMVGVCGMGGVGKTMLAKEVARRATDEEKLFTKVVFTAISKGQKIKKIQQDIGEKLYMEFREESMDARANQLRNRLTQEDNKILIIVDDIWDKLDLEDVGISLGGKDQKGCKILLTTRSGHVLANDMSVDSNFIFDVGVLLENEAMSLFRKIVGDQADKHGYLASEIVEECGGLPIAITTVASALKNKGFAVWKNALLELRKSNPINIPGLKKEVYTSIKWSYDYLESVEAKHLLLLCSPFPGDTEIPIRVLCDYGFALNLFEDVNTLEEARKKTDALVTKLKDHSLLLDADSSYLGYDCVCVKLHNVIRDVVIYVASNHRMHNMTNADELEKYFNKEMFNSTVKV